MSNQFHRLLTNAELHRPERTGRGNPNLLTDDVDVEGGISQVEDGQYYQDITTGDIYRFVKFDTTEEFDRYGQFIGSTTSTIEEGDVRKRIDVTNQAVSSTSGLTLLDGQSLILQDDLGNFQVVLVDGKQTFISSTFSVKVRSFTHEFAIGGDVNGALISSNKDGKWERLISYDRETESITNVLLKADSEAIGEVTQAFGGSLEEVVVQQGRVVYKYNGVIYDTFGEAEEAAVDDGVEREKILEDEIRPIKIEPVKEIKKVLGDVTQITANLFTEITEGQELVVFARNSQGNLTSDSIKLTVNDNGDGVTDSYGAGENVVIDVQDDKTLLQFPVGSLIFSEDSYRESSLRVDPSRIQLAVIGARGGDGIGVLTSDVGEGTTTQISLNRIDDTVTLKDNQALILTNKFGDVKKFTVNGDQVLSAGSDTLNVNNIVIAAGEPIFEAGTATVKEPSYSTSSRITVQEDSITSAVNLATNAVNATSSIEQRVSATEASISSQASLIDDNSSLIAGVTSRVSTTETEIGTLNQSVTNIQNVLQQNDVTAIAGLQTSVEGIEGDINTITARAVLTTDVNGNIATIDLESGVVGSAITIEANSVSINNVEFIQGSGGAPGEIRSDNYVTGSSGWFIDGNGDAEFNSVQIRSANFSNLNSGFELLENSVQINGTLFIGNSQDTGRLEFYNSFEDRTSLIIQPFVTTAFWSTVSNNHFMQFGKERDLDGAFLGTTIFNGTFELNAPRTTFSVNRSDVVYYVEVNGGDLRVTSKGPNPGDIEYDGQLVSTSDRFLKENVEPLGNTLDKITQLEAKVYDMVGPSTRKEIGLFAQDVEALFPEAVSERVRNQGEEDEFAYKTVAYIQLIPALIESIKELNQKINERDSIS